MWELEYKKSWVPKNWCFWTVVLAKTLESPLNCKESQPVHPKGNQCWIFIERTDVEAETPILLLPDAKNWLIWKDPDAGKNWGQEEKGTTEEEIIGFPSLMRWKWVWVGFGSWWWTWRPGMLHPWNPWGPWCRKEPDTIEQLNSTEHSLKIQLLVEVFMSFSSYGIFF